MAVKFRSRSQDINPDGVDAASVTLSRPADLADGDVMILVTHGFVGDGGLADADAYGFERLATVDDGSGHRSRAYKKIADNEPSSYTIDFTAGTGGAIGATLAAFSGGNDVLTWSYRVTSTTDPAEGWRLTAVRDAVGWQVYTWRNDTSNAGITWSTGEEITDFSSKSSSAIHRGQGAMYYGPESTSNIINAGDSLASATANVSTTPLFGIFWNFLIGDKEADNETWSSTNGDFAVDVKMDRVGLNSTGSITTPLTGDATGLVSAFAATVETNPASQAADGARATEWLDDSSATPWLRYDFGSGVTKTIRRYRITSADSLATFDASLDPQDWTLEGSQNASSWTTVDTRAGESFGHRSETREFRVASPGAYRYYRILISQNWGNTTGAQIAEFRLSTIDVWEDVTVYVQEEDKIRITRGFQGTSGRSDFSRAYFTLDNTDGRFSLRNPLGAYAGAIQRNSEVRISKAFGTKALQLQGAVEIPGTNMIGDCFRAPLTDDTAVSSDFQIDIDLDLESWHAEQSLAGISDDIGTGPAGWHLFLDDDGKINFTWKESGGSTRTAQSTIAIPDAVRQSIRVHIDVNNGGGGNNTTFSTASTFGGSYTQLGDTVVLTGITNISYVGGAVCIGHVAGRDPRGLHGKVYNFELRDALVGPTTVSDIDFTALANGTKSHYELTNDWVAVNNSVVSNRRYRFHGEIAEWPLAWDTTGNWVYVDITAAGVQKRLERGSATGSTMYRYHTRGIVSSPGSAFVRNTAYAYWPMEDGENSFQVSSALPGRPHMEVYGNPEFANYTEFHESAAILKLGNAKLGGRVTGIPSGYTDVRFLLSVPQTIAVGTIIVSLWMTGTYAKHDVVYVGTNSWEVRTYLEADLETAFSVTTSPFTVTTVGELLHVRIVLDQVGSDIELLVDAISVAGEDMGGFSGTLAASATTGRIYRVQVNDANVSRLDEGYIGHLAVYGSESPPFDGPINSYHYERAADRIERICDEEALSYRQIGAASDSTFMGYQSPDSPQAIMSSASHSDIGYLSDPLDAFGVEYRTGRSLFNLAPRLTLSYTGNELSGELRPVGDDSYIVNDQTVSRGDAGSARFQLTEGALSVNAPPMGVGPYADQQSFSLAHEGQCVDLASWLVHQGTIDEEHYPSIQVALENLRIAASSSLTEAVLDLDIGQRVDITDTPAFLPAEDIRQLVVGYEEWFDNFQHNLKLNTIPERAFESAQYDTEYRFDTAGSTLYIDIDEADTSFSVNTTVGPLWDSALDEDFYIEIDGELMLVTSISQNQDEDTADTFNRANSTTNLGSTDSGDVQAWTQNSGTWGIDANRAYISAAATSVATIIGSSDFTNLDVEVDVWAAGDAWLVFRYLNTSNHIRFGGTVGSPAEIQVVVGGVVTRTDTSARNLAATDELRVRCSGSVIEMFIDGDPVMTITETANMDNTRVGLRTTSTSPRFDNFSYSKADDPQIFNVTRSQNGVVKPHKGGTAVSLYNKPYRAL